MVQTRSKSAKQREVEEIEGADVLAASLSLTKNPMSPPHKKIKLEVAIKSISLSTSSSPGKSVSTPATSVDEENEVLVRAVVKDSVKRPASGALASFQLSEAVATDENDDDDDDEDYIAPMETVKEVEVVEKEEQELAGTASYEAEEEEEMSDSSIESRRRARGTGWGLSQYEKTMAKLAVHHPDLLNVWGDLEQKQVKEPCKAQQPEILTLKLLPFQLEGLNWLRLQEQSKFRGGILADEMGMGKTIQTVAMLVSDKSRQEESAGTLIVAPTVAIMQWKSEIELYCNNKLKVLIYHGTNREADTEKIKSFDIVLTTYNLLESVYRRQQSGFKRKHITVKEASVLHGLEFHRIVLDEAHNIKDRSCATARAVFALQARYRWCLSGTPLQNRVGELFSLLRFLQIDPFSYYYCKKCACKSLHWKFSDKRTCDECHHRPMDHTCWFNHELLKPIQRFGATGQGGIAFKKIHNLLGQLMLRRTKIERADDMGLPPRVVTVRRDLFNDEEEDLFRSLYSESKRKFNTYADEGTVLNNYANIFQLLTRMRQVSDHADLVLRRNNENGANNLVCRICDDLSEDAIKSKCHHVFCRNCVKDYQEGFVGATPDCPVCHVALNIDLTAPSLEAVSEEMIKKNSIINRIDMSKWRSSTKIEALVEELYRLRSRDSSIKSIVFSQWTSFLELVNWRLHKAGFQCCKLDGTMTPEQRANTIKHFSENPNVSVFLVSLKAGGVALNLTEASQVFILDPWWNPSVEWQAADRVHRIGQHRPVKITRLIVENSIESRIVELQEKKAQMIAATVSTDEAAMNRLTAEDMSFLFM